MICATCHTETAEPFAIEVGTEGDSMELLGQRMQITRGIPDRCWCSLACWPWAPPTPSRSIPTEIPETHA